MDCQKCMNKEFVWGGVTPQPTCLVVGDAFDTFNNG